MNLFDEIKKSNIEELTELTAKLKICRLKLFYKSLLDNAVYYLMIVNSFFASILNKKIEVRKPMHTEEILDAEIRALKTLDQGQIIMQLKDYVRRDAGTGLNGFPINKNASEYQLSVRVIKAAMKCFRNTDTNGMSVMEMGDYIFREYPRKKRVNIMLILKIWLWFSLFAGIASTALLIKFRSVWLFAISAVILEFIPALLFQNKISCEKLATFVWLCASSRGFSFAPEMTDMPTENLSDDALYDTDIRIRVCHTLKAQLDSLNKERNELIEQIDSYNNTISTNNDLISRTYDDHTNENYSVRVRNDKEKENNEIEKLIKKAETTIRDCDKEIDKVSLIFEDTVVHEADRLKTRWTKAYRGIDFEDEMLWDAIVRFSINDFPKIEQRLEELYSSSEPETITRMDKKGRYISFRCSNDDVARIYICFDETTDGLLRIMNIERDGELLETPLNQEELSEALNKIAAEKSDARNYNVESDYLSALKELDSYKEQLSVLNSQFLDLRGKKNRLEDELSDLEEKQEILEESNRKLNTQIDNKQKECLVLKRQLGELREKEEDNRDRINLLEKKYNNALSALESQKELKNKIEESLKTTAAQLKLKEEELNSARKAFELKGQEFDQFRKESREQIDKNVVRIKELEQKSTDDNKKIEMLEGNLNTMKSLKKNTEQKLSEMDKTISDLRRQLSEKNGDRQLRDKLAKKEEEYNSIRKTYEKIVANQEAVRNQYEESNAEKERLKEQIKEIETKNSELYDKLDSETKKYNMVLAENDILNNTISELEYELQNNIRNNNRTIKLCKKRECRDIFQNSFQEAKESIFIIAPWINNYILNEKKTIDKIDKALNRGVKVTVGYGITTDNKLMGFLEKMRNGNTLSKSEMKDAKTMEQVLILRKRFENQPNFRIFNAVTHEKILSYDALTLVGSYNFLSFDGSGAREESAVLVSGQEFAREVCGSFSERISMSSQG